MELVTSSTVVHFHPDLELASQGLGASGSQGDKLTRTQSSSWARVGRMAVVRMQPFLGSRWGYWGRAGPEDDGSQRQSGQGRIFRTKEITTIRSHTVPGKSSLFHKLAEL